MPLGDAGQDDLVDLVEIERLEDGADRTEARGVAPQGLLLQPVDPVRARLTAKFPTGSTGVVRFGNPYYAILP